MTQLVSYSSDSDSTDVQSTGDSKHYVEISEEGKATICVHHLNGSICN